MRAAPLLAGALLVLLSGVHSVAADEPAVPADVQRLMERFQQAIPEGPPTLHEVYDVAGLAHRARVVLPDPGPSRSGPLAGPAMFDTAWGEAALKMMDALDERGDVPAFTAHQVLRWSPASDERSGVLVVAIAKDDTTWAMRLWLVRGAPEAVWRIADSEFVVMGLRDSLLAARKVDVRVVRGAEAYRRAWDRLRAAEGLLDEGKPAEALERLAELAATLAPGPLLGHVHSRRAKAALDAERPEVALEAARQAREADPSIACALLFEAQAHLQQRHLEAALQRLALYRGEVGDELRGLRLTLQILERQGRRAEALDVATRGVALYPRFSSFAGARLRLLPADRKLEALPDLLRVDDLADASDAAADIYSAEAGEPAVLEVLVRAFEDKAPGHPHLPLYRAALRVAMGDLEAGLDVLGAALESFTDAGAREPLRLMLARLPWSTPWSGERHVTSEQLRAQTLACLTAAPRADRPWVFSDLAAELALSREDEALEALVGLSRETGGVGPDLPYYEAALAWMRQDHLGALAALDRLTVPATLPDDAHESLERALHVWPLTLRVRALVRLGRSAEALAPARARFLRDGDARLLLIAHAHAGNIEATVRAFEAQVAREQDPKELFEDADIHGPLAGEAYKELRARHGLAN